MSPAQIIRDLCDAIRTQINPNTQKPYIKKEIGAIIFEGDITADVLISKAQDLTTSNLRKIGGKMRAEIITIIQTEFKNELKAANYRSRQAMFFRFKQYFMDGEATDEQKVTAAQLDLHYEYNADNSLHYTTFSLAIIATKDYPVFRLEGTAQQFGDTCLVLISQSETHHSTTILHVTLPFFKTKPFDYLYYNGFYVTRSSVGEQIAGPVILQMTDIEQPFTYDIPPKVSELLHKTRHNIEPPF